MSAKVDFLLKQHRALLDASGISPDVAEARGYVSVDTKATLARFGFSRAQRRVPGLLIPVHSIMGKVAFHQYRPDSPRTSANGKAVKYETPPKVRMVLDVHPHARKALGDPGIPLWITEGSRKADAAVSRGLCCIDLLGVFSFRGRNEEGGKVALADWELVALNGRDVYLCFDSDATTKAQVRGALRRLRGFLELRGARVHVVYLPGSTGGAKVGLDDYLAAGHSVDDLLTLATDDVREPTPQPLVATHATSATLPSVPPPETSALLFAVAAFVRRYVVATADQILAVTLWVLHTWTLGAADTTPYLRVESAQPASGKTRLLEVLSLLVPNAWQTGRTTVAALVRKIPGGCTLLLDESDRAFQVGEEYGAALLAVLNSGYRRGGVATVCVGAGAQVRTRDFPVFGPKAFAGLGRLPDTLVSRSIPIRLRRRTKDEPVQRFFWREAKEGTADLVPRLAAWATSSVARLKEARPRLPDTLGDRTAECWEPLLAIADSAGGEWPERARAAAVALHGDAEVQEQAVSVVLLRTIREVFEEIGTNEVATADLLKALADRDDGPWADWWGRAVSTGDFKGPGFKLARLLKPFGVEPDRLSATVRGYRKADFQDAWARYTPPTPVVAAENDDTMTNPLMKEGEGHVMVVSSQGATEAP